MSDVQLQEQIAAARAYEDLFVPALFQQWVTRVIDAAQILVGQRVLDVACGTGVLTREVASRVGASGFTAGLDIAPGMLAVAKQIAPEIVWKQGTADSLPYPDQSFDAVVCQFGLMFFPDRLKSLREMLRVLVPGGHLAVAVWDSLDNIPAFACEVALLERIAGSPAADALRAPFVLGDRNALASLAEEAGAASVQVQTHMGQAKFPSIRSLVEADLRGWLPIMGVVLPEHQIQQILEEAEDALRSFANTQGQAVFDIPAHIVSGTKS
jgi:SAM-dependent methyltransferase